MLDLLAGFAYEARLDDEANEQQRVQDEEIREESAAALSTVTHGRDVVDEVKERRSLRDRHKRGRTRSSPDYAVVRQDLERIRRTLASQQTVAAAIAAPMPETAAATPSPALKSLSPVIAASPSPMLTASDGATVALVPPESPTHSLAPLSPPSSRSVSPIRNPRSRSLSPHLSPQLNPSTQLTPPFHPNAAEYRSPPALAAITPSKATALAHLSRRPSPSSYLVEAILGHRGVGGAGVEDEVGWEGDRARWVAGEVFEYSIRWVGWKEPTWEPQRNVSQWLVHMYWEGRGARLWSERDMEALVHNHTQHHNTHHAQPTHTESPQQQQLQQEQRSVVDQHTHDGRSLLTPL